MAYQMLSTQAPKIVFEVFADFKAQDMLGKKVQKLQVLHDKARSQVLKNIDWINIGISWSFICKHVSK